MRDGALKLLPEFSVVIPWHRDRGLLRRAIASVIAQTYPAFETIVVCNGAAARESREIAPEFLPFELVTLSSAEADANSARNIGIDAARGNYVALLDADDEFTSDKLAAMADFIRAGHTDEVICSRGMRVRTQRVQWIFPRRVLHDGEKASEYFFVHGNFLSSSAIVLPTAIGRRLHFEAGLKKFQDLMFLMQAQAIGLQITVLPKPLFIYHDEETENRISRIRSFHEQLSWANDCTLLDERSRAAFCARAVAQHDFPQHFWTNLQLFYRGCRVGGIPLLSTLMMMARGCLPRPLRDIAFVAFSLHRSPDPAE